MNFRRLLLRIMLVALGVAAFTGALGIMTAAGSGLWRFVGTSFLTAIAVALILPVSRAMDTPAKRDGGLAGIVWIIVAFLFILLLIWSAHLFPDRFSDRLALLVLYWFLCGIPAVGLCFSIRLEQFRPAAFTGIAILALIFAVLCVGTIILSLPDRQDEKVAATAFAMAGFGFTLVLNLANVGRYDRHYFRWAGVGAGILGFFIALASIWSADEVHMDVVQGILI